ncbi:MAG TPA: AI-2E family transporter [Candidatus Paceibacterota bacterium]|nr:AI-2E family transporter [Candidatus Paceibacterota bacterium]
MIASKGTTKISTGSVIRIILLIFAALLAWRLREIILLLIVSIVIASFVEAGVRAVERLGLKRIVAVPIIFTVVIGALLMVFYAFVPILFRELSSVIVLLSKYLPSAAPVTSEGVQGATQLVSSLAHQSSLSGLLSGIQSATSVLSQGATSVIGSTFGGLLNIILVVVMSFYLSIQEHGIDAFLRILTPAKDEKYVVDLWARTQRKIGLWFKGQLLLGLIVGAITIVVLVLLGMQYAFLIGLVSGIAELIPFGILFAAVIAILLAVINGGVILAIKVLIFYVILHEIESYILSPVISKRVVGIPPLVVLLAFLIGITLAGFWGALIAMPVAVFVLEYLSDIEKQKLVPVTDVIPK